MAKNYRWIAMAGIRGCMPNFCYYLDTKVDAIECILDVHDRPYGAKVDLQEDHYTERIDGNEYASIEKVYLSETELAELAELGEIELD